MKGYNVHHYARMIEDKHTPEQILRLCADMLGNEGDKELIIELIDSIQFN